MQMVSFNWLALGFYYLKYLWRFKLFAYTMTFEDKSISKVPIKIFSDLNRE
jgi:hypothetical protein